MPVQTQAITKGYEVDSLCECQGILGATLNSERLVLEGWVRRAGERERTPANTVGQEADRFDIVWLCTLCGRNTLRTFHAAALREVALPEPEPPSEPPNEASTNA